MRLTESTKETLIMLSVALFGQEVQYELGQLCCLINFARSVYQSYLRTCKCTNVYITTQQASAKDSDRAKFQLS